MRINHYDKKKHLVPNLLQSFSRPMVWLLLNNSDEDLSSMTQLTGKTMRLNIGIFGRFVCLSHNVLFKRVPL